MGLERERGVVGERWGVGRRGRNRKQERMGTKKNCHFGRPVHWREKKEEKKTLAATEKTTKRERERGGRGGGGGGGGGDKQKTCLLFRL